MIDFVLTQNALDRGVTMDMLGWIPDFFSEMDSRPARDQIDQAYAHGGGWRPFSGFRLASNGVDLLYPGDPPTRCLATAHLREETIRFYEHAWVGIFQPDGSFEVSRCD